MTRFSSGTSKSVNTRKAVMECLAQADANTDISPALILVHSTSGHKLEQVVETLVEQAPGSRIVGCTGSGVVGANWVSEAMRALAILVVYDCEVAIQTVNDVTGDNCGEQTLRCAKALKEDLPTTNLLICFGPGLGIDGDAIVQGIDTVFSGEIPLMGALAGFGGQIPRMPVFVDNTVQDNTIVLVGIHAPDLEVVQVQHHGSPPQPDRFVVTRSQGQTVYELDGLPAWPRLMASIGLPPDTQPIDVVTLIALGLDLNDTDQAAYDNVKMLRAPLIVGPEGTSCIFQVTVPEGTVFTACQRDEQYLFSGTIRLMERLNEQLAGRRPLAILHADCMARGRMSHNSVEKDGIVSDMQKALSLQRDIPWLGVYGFAEFGMLNGRNRMHNYTTTLSAIVRPIPGEKDQPER